MGAVQSLVSPEAAATATAAIVVAGAVGYGVATMAQERSGDKNLDTASSATGANSKGKKKKKQSGAAESATDFGGASSSNVTTTTTTTKGATTVTAATTETVTLVPFPQVIPGDFDVTPSTTNVPVKGKNKDKDKGKAKPVVSAAGHDDGGGGASSATPSETPPVMMMNSGSKSKKAKKKKKPTTTTAAAVASPSNLASTPPVASSSKVSSTTGVHHSLCSSSSSAGFEEKETHSLHSSTAAAGIGGVGAITGRSKESLKSAAVLPSTVENEERPKPNLGLSPSITPTATNVVPIAAAAHVVDPLSSQDHISHDTDSSWTHVRRSTGNLNRKSSHSGYPSTSGVSTAEFTTSDAGVASPMTDDGYPSSSVAERVEDTEEEEAENEGLGSAIHYVRDATNTQRRPLAERLLPKPRKTGVEDMLENPDHPTLSRVLRVHPLPGEKPVSGFSWADYEDVHVDQGAGHDADGEDDGWGVVRSRRSKSDRGASTATTNSAAAPNSTQAEKASSGSLSKKQRQNAKKREVAKSAKADAEAQRLAMLVKHKQQLEKTRMMEQVSKGAGKTPSGGMKAAVDDNGKLVWE